MMQPYLNPNYFNQYNQMPNPYMDRMAQLQQYQQSLQQPMLPTQMSGTWLTKSLPIPIKKQRTNSPLP